MDSVKEKDLVGSKEHVWDWVSVKVSVLLIFASEGLFITREDRAVGLPFWRVALSVSQIILTSPPVSCFL